MLQKCSLSNSTRVHEFCVDKSEETCQFLMSFLKKNLVFIEMHYTKLGDKRDSHLCKQQLAT